MIDLLNELLGYMMSMFNAIYGLVSGVFSLFPVMAGFVTSNGVQFLVGLLPDMLIGLAFLIIAIRLVLAMAHGGKG